MSHARSNSLPAGVLLGQKPEKKKHRGIFRRLAKAIPGRKKKSPGPYAATGEDNGSGSESLDPMESPQPLTPSTSVDSLVDEIDSASPLHAALHTAKLSLVQPVEVLREVKTVLEFLQSDNKSSQVPIHNRLFNYLLTSWSCIIDYNNIMYCATCWHGINKVNLAVGANWCQTAVLGDQGVYQYIVGSNVTRVATVV